MLFGKALLLAVIALSTATKEPELPLCPTNIQFLPQNLPMHCRMPRPGEMPAMPPGMQLPPGMALPPGMQLPPGMDMSQGAPMGMPGFPMPMPYPGGPMMPMTMPGAPAGGKLPVIVMPFYKPEKKDGNDKKPKRGRHSSSDTDSSSDDTSSDTDTTDTSSDSDRFSLWDGRRASGRRSGAGRSGSNRRRHHRHRAHKSKRKPLYTPVLQYVTNDGYVIYEKKISTNEADNWLKVNSRNSNRRANRDDNASVGNNDDEDDEIKTQAGTHYKPKSEVETVEPVIIHKRKNTARVSQLRDKLKYSKISKSSLKS